MSTLAQTFDQAIAYHQRGHLREAEQLYQQVLRVDPQNVDALYLLGIIAQQVGSSDLALDYLNQVLRLKPHFAEAHNNRGIALLARGALAEAMASFQRAVQLKPDYAEAHNNLGIAQRQQGQLAEAVASYQRALQLKPDYAEAHNSLGNALRQQGQLAEAVASYQRALQLKPDYAEAHFNLGNAFGQQGKLGEAVASYRRALQLRPDYTEVHFDLGIALQEQGALDEAVSSYRRALQLLPNYPEAHNNLGNALAKQGKPDEAAACYQQALRLQPDYAEAHTNLGNALVNQGRPAEAEASYRRALQLRPDYTEAHYNLGVALANQERPVEAEACYRRALQLRPDYAEAHNNLGVALINQERPAEAEACYRRVLQLRPDDAEAHSNLGNALAKQGKLSEAEASYRRALQLRPDYAEAHSNLGVALANQGRLGGAEASYRRALQFRPGDAEAHKNLGIALLLLGDFERGWPEYEWRWKCKELSHLSFPKSPWDGSPLAGRTILLHAEQGLGDTLQFIRYAPLVMDRGGRVVVACQRPLIRLLASCPGIDQLIAKGEALPSFDIHAPLLSLPRIFSTTLSYIPAEVPYLRADDVLVEHWRRELGPIPSLKIGIAWQGRVEHPGDRHRSFRLAQFAPLSRLAGVRLFSLQKGPGTEQLREMADGFDVTDLGSRLDDFGDTAAVMKNLDLVITADSSPAHLAGALGVPVWVALPYASDWRWLLEREDSPWYPTMRLFRQSRWGDWDGVFDRIAGALEARLRTAFRAKPIAIEVAPGELLDKIAILQTTSERITDAVELGHARVKLAALLAARDRALGESEELAEWTAELKAVNEALWEIEDALRACERGGEFGPRFIELARSAYRTNDRRAALKRRINERLGSNSIDDRGYASYEEAGSAESRSSEVAFGKGSP
jgi:tetratricopeptide (TPR) repeat protein